MKTLYFDCSMGAAGDMLTAALLELFPEPDNITDELNSLGIPNVLIKREPSVKCGITGTHVSVTVNGIEESEDMHGHHHEHKHEHHHDHEHKHHHGHHHSGMDDISNIISGLHIPDKVSRDVQAVYRLIAEAESHVHGKPVSEIHFHEVGTMDAIADVTAVCYLINRLSPDRIAASPVCTGSGQVRCAHGTLPVPAPATAYILRDMPIYSGKITGELCTPTGAALLKHFVTSFGEMPVMKVSAIGYGMGKKDFEAANCVRAMLGETQGPTDTVTELCCTLDDMTPEMLGFAMERLLEAGALDVYTVPVNMKKNRPGVMLCVMCAEDKRQETVKLIFRHTSTLGIRENVSRRYTLDRRIETVHTPFGDVRKKISSGYGAEKEKFEYDDLSKIAREENLSISEVIKNIDK